jgi:hypothetical protein
MQAVEMNGSCGEAPLNVRLTFQPVPLAQKLIFLASLVGGIV